MKKYACQYALLRFRPFAETGEFANVGVVLLAPELRYFDFRLLRKYGRITRFFHQLDATVYRNGRALCQDELDRFAATLRRLALDAQVPDAPLAGNLFAELVRPREALFHFDERRIVLASDPKAKLDELFDFYVNHNFVTKEYQERLLEHSVRKLLLHAEVSAQYHQEKLGGADFAVSFPFVCKVGEQVDRVIKPLYLAQADSTKVLNHGGQWVDRVRRLHRRHALPAKVLFPVQAPARDAKSYAAYEEICDDLRNEDVTVLPADAEVPILEFLRAA